MRNRPRYHKVTFVFHLSLRIHVRSNHTFDYMRPLALRPCTSPKGPSGLRRKGTAEGSITYKIFGRRVCKVVFMALTGVNAKVLQKARDQLKGINDTVSRWQPPPRGIITEETGQGMGCQGMAY